MFTVKISARQLVITAFLSIATAIAAPLIGIVQYIEHPALDQTRKGILDELKAQGYEGAWESAQGTPALATQIVSKFLGNKAAIVVAIATVPAQIALNQCKSSQTPIVFASVTDPESAKLTGNITGVSNFIDVDQQLSVILKTVPKAKILGFIYNPGEANSQKLLELTCKACDRLGITLKTAVASRTSDVPAATQSLMGKVDGIFINNDSTALAAFESIVKVAQKSKIPVFVSDIDFVEKGAVAALGPDQYEIGRLAGKMIIQILKGEKSAGEIPILYPTKVEVRVNKEMAADLGIVLPDDLLERAK